MHIGRFNRSSNLRSNWRWNTTETWRGFGPTIWLRLTTLKVSKIRSFAKVYNNQHLDSNITKYNYRIYPVQFILFQLSIDGHYVVASRSLYRFSPYNDNLNISPSFLVNQSSNYYYYYYYYYYYCYYYYYHYCFVFVIDVHFDVLIAELVKLPSNAMTTERTNRTPS